jgi:hypothetical protein
MLERPVSDPNDSPTPPARPTTRRQRRFVMPDDHHDARTSERIEAFLEGPARPHRHRRRTGPRRPHRPIVFDTPAEWLVALRQEDDRIARYGRPATVLVVDFTSRRSDIELDTFAEPIADAIRHEARETDRVARVGRSRFTLLLRETEDIEATHLADRLGNACRDRLNGDAGALDLRIEAAGPTHGQPLEDALAEVERRLDG